VSSLRQVAAASTLTSHHCEILLRSLATRTAEGESGELSAGLLKAADAAGRASIRWLSVAHSLDYVTTDTQGLSGRPPVHATLRCGQGAWPTPTRTGRWPAAHRTRHGHRIPWHPGQTMCPLSWPLCTTHAMR
jgi:hypothetical protein